MDPKRPALAEHPGNKQGSSSRNSAGGEQFTNPGGYQGMPPVGFSGRPPMMYGGGKWQSNLSYYGSEFHSTGISHRVYVAMCRIQTYDFSGGEHWLYR
jgi:hypothetical protein